MSLFKFLLFVPLHVVMIILTYFLAIPLGLLSVLIGKPELPGFLKWFYTHDDDMDGGQNQLDWPKKKGLGLAIQRARWMWRNPAYGFRATVLGFPSAGSKTEIHKQVGNPGEDGFIQKVTITSAKGKKYFGRRSNKTWFGWRHPQSGGYHIFKCSIRKG